jgi:hypothetical protein
MARSQIGTQGADSGRSRLTTTWEAFMLPQPKAFDARRRIRPEAARRLARTRIQKTDRKQMMRQVGRRRGGH